MPKPVYQPPTPWKPHYFISQHWELHIDELPLLDVGTFQTLKELAPGATDLSPKQLAIISSAYRRVAIVTTAIIVNLISK